MARENKISEVYERKHNNSQNNSIFLFCEQQVTHHVRVGVRVIVSVCVCLCMQMCILVRMSVDMSVDMSVFM